MADLSMANVSTDINCFSGGSAVVTLAASVGTGADTPCRFCRVQARTGNSGTTRCRIGEACTGTTGVALPPYPTLTPYSVNNLSLLNFYGTTADVIDIEYFT